MLRACRMSDDEPLRHPAGVLVRQSRRLLRLIRARDNLAAHAQLMTMDRSALLMPAIRSWLLLTAELGAARLPGGALAEPDNAGGLIRAEVGDEQPWQLGLRQALIHAAARDGDRLFPVVARHAAGPDRLQYVTSIAATAGCIVDSVNVSPEAVGAAHLLGYYARQPGHWSVAGYGLRQIVVTLAVVDTGYQFADTMLGPEIEALGALSAHDQGRLLGVLGGAFGAVMGDATGISLHPGSGPDGPDGPVQERAARIAMTVGRAYRGELSDLTRLAERLTPDEIALGCYGLGNMLAVRCRELWGR